MIAINIHNEAYSVSYYWTLHGNLILTCVSGNSCFVWKNVGDDRRLLYIGSYTETLAIKIHKSLKGSFFGLKWLL